MCQFEQERIIGRPIIFIMMCFMPSSTAFSQMPPKAPGIGSDDIFWRSSLEKKTFLKNIQDQQTKGNIEQADNHQETQFSTTATVLPCRP